MFRRFALLFALASAGAASAQDAEPVEAGRRAVERVESLGEIETDRDSFTPATSVVGRSRLVVESAYSFLDNRGVKETHSFPELLMRYGITDRIEVRLGWNYEVGGAGNSATGVDASDEDVTGRNGLIREHNLAYGLKVLIAEQNTWRPRVSAILQGFTPTGGPETATQMVATLAAGWELPNRWRFDTAIRYGTDSEEGDHFNDWAPSVVLKMPFAEKWAAHAEYFALTTTSREVNDTKHYFSPGLHYLVTPDLEVGFRLGWGLNEPASRFFANVGFGGRF